MRFLMRAIAAALLVTASAAASGLPFSTATAAPALPDLLPLHATHGTNPAIVDSAGRQVILRGVNLNTLGDYYQANAAYPTTYPYADADFAEMARYGFDVVRLIVSWSKLEPTQGTIDEAYVAAIHHAVDAAAAEGIYTVIDMHQDAWGKYIASPPGVVCGPGLSPAIGWDGAPEWATLTNGGDTCKGSGREDSEAVKNSWDNFYLDTNGIQAELVGVWGRLGAEFAHDPAVAGYDLLNEPNEGHLATTVVATDLGAYFGRAIAAIRAGEQSAGAGALSHIALFETSIYGTTVPVDFTADTNIVFAPHNYAESIVGALTIEGLFGFFRYMAGQYGTPMWTGEYGWFGDPPANKAKVIRFATAEDSLAPVVAGSTWWQWVQACGDPHSIGTPNGTPGATLTHFHTSTCPGDVLTGVPDAWSIPLSRPLVRGAPGRILSLASDGDTTTMQLRGDPTGASPAAGAGAQLDLWVADLTTNGGLGTTSPLVQGTGFANVRIVSVPGGWRVFADVCGAYTVSVSPAGTVGPTPPATCPSTTTTTITTAPTPGAAATPATPVSASPAFTG